MPTVKTKKRTLLGGAVYYETTISEHGQRVVATGRSPEQARSKAEDRWAERRLGRR